MRILLVTVLMFLIVAWSPESDQKINLTELYQLYDYYTYQDYFDFTGDYYRPHLTPGLCNRIDVWLENFILDLISEGYYAPFTAPFNEYVKLVLHVEFRNNGILTEHIESVGNICADYLFGTKHDDFPGV